MILQIQIQHRRINLVSCVELRSVTAAFSVLAMGIKSSESGDHRAAGRPPLEARKACRADDEGVQPSDQHHHCQAAQPAGECYECREIRLILRNALLACDLLCVVPVPNSFVLACLVLLIIIVVRVFIFLSSNFKLPSNPCLYSLTPPLDHRETKRSNRFAADMSFNLRLPEPIFGKQLYMCS